MFWEQGKLGELGVVERTRNGGRLPPNPPTGGRSASPRPPAQGVSDTLGLGDWVRGLARETWNLSREIPGLAREVLKLTREAPRLNDKIPRLAHEVPKLDDEVLRLAREVPRLAHEVPRLNDEVLRLNDEILRLAPQSRRLPLEVPRLDSEVPNQVVLQACHSPLAQGPGGGASSPSGGFGGQTPPIPGSLYHP